LFLGLCMWSGFPWWNYLPNSFMGSSSWQIAEHCSLILFHNFWRDGLYIP
jgi:hypothetical protein